MIGSRHGRQEGGLTQQELHHVQERENKKGDWAALEIDDGLRLKHIRTH